MLLLRGQFRHQCRAPNVVSNEGAPNRHFCELRILNHRKHGGLLLPARGEKVGMRGRSLESLTHVMWMCPLTPTLSPRVGRGSASAVPTSRRLGERLQRLAR